MAVTSASGACGMDPKHPAIRVRPADTDCEMHAVQALLREYRQWLGPQRDSPRLAAELARLPGAYTPPCGALLLATCDGMPAGCIGLRRQSPDSGELKRLFVTRRLRRRGVARVLLSEAIRTAREIGYSRLLLDMVAGMATAKALYVAAGFRDIDAYYPQASRARCFMCLQLRDPGPGP